MGELTEKYEVKIINSHEEFDPPLVVEFTCLDPEHVKILVSVFWGHYPGDPIDVFINGEKAVTDLDWGLFGG